MTAIGFIGLGLMGAAMVGRLQDKGYALNVLGNRDRTGVEAALARGATEAATAKELAQASDIIMLCMGTSVQVEGRMRGDDGVIAGLSDGKVVVDFGTSLPSSTKALGDEVSAQGATLLDAPLGRTAAGAYLTGWFPDAIGFLRIDSLTVDIMSVINTAGNRAIMIGIALGLVSTSLKILIGVDRSYLGSGEE